MTSMPWPSEAEARRTLAAWRPALFSPDAPLGRFDLLCCRLGFGVGWWCNALRLRAFVLRNRLALRAFVLRRWGAEVRRWWADRPAVRATHHAIATRHAAFLLLRARPGDGPLLAFLATLPMPTPDVLAAAAAACAANDARDAEASAEVALIAEALHLTPVDPSHCVHPSLN